jgi:rhamnosyltransferase
MISANEHVHAVVVTYYPQVDWLRELLVSLAVQAAGIVVVDNTPKADLRVEALLKELSLPKIALERLGDNFGIAKALNVGIELAKVNGAKYVLLSDQDSLPSPDLISGLLRAHAEMVAKNVRVGAIGPLFTDLHTHITHPFQVEIPGKFLYGHACPTPESPLVETFTLITSGTLIPVDIFSDVGTMREDFFIDQVDNEWCHRARSRGYRLYGTSYATMSHRLGDAHLRVWFFGWRRESAYGSMRVYYRIRNFVVLCKMPHISLGWKLRGAGFWLGFLYSQVFFGRERTRSFYMAVRGLCDGLSGVLGRLSH